MNWHEQWWMSFGRFCSSVVKCPCRPTSFRELATQAWIRWHQEKIYAFLCTNCLCSCHFSCKTIDSGTTCTWWYGEELCSNSFKHDMYEERLPQKVIRKKYGFLVLSEFGILDTVQHYSIFVIPTLILRCSVSSSYIIHKEQKIYHVPELWKI